MWRPKKGLHQKWNTFFSEIQVKTKKKGLHQNWNTFSHEFRWAPTLRCTPESNYWGDADVDHTQTIGGDTVKLLGGYILPGFRHPCMRGTKFVSMQC